MKRLRDDVRLDIVYDDQTAYGSALSGRADATVRQACARIVDYRKRHGAAATVANSRQLFDEAFANELSSLFLTRDTLREEFLYPATDRVFPAAIAVSDAEGIRGTIPVPRGSISELASWIFEIQRGTHPPAAAAGRPLFDQLDACGALTEDPIQAESSPPSADVLLVGHATILVTSGARVLIDPFILPRSERYPKNYQPHRIADLLPLDAALITHSHPDHFDISTLLRLGSHLPIYVPEVGRESLLAIDMAARLEQVGFSNVHRVCPGAEVTTADLKIRVLPFLGEQPTTGDILHPEVRNAGCTYLWESRERRMMAIADSGRDRAGDVRDVAAAIRKEFGDIDVVFGGYRAFAMYPILYLFSSVARFFMFVPPGELTVRQEIMNDGDALLDTAERAGARYVVPYATGGAPWYWERGLGWHPKGVPGAQTDSTPDEVVRIAAARGSSPEGPFASPVRVLLVQGGESVSLSDSEVQIEHGANHAWPYNPPAWQQVNVALTRVEGSLLNSARAVFRELQPAVDRWRRENRLSCFFFMRKDPGVRLRFLGDAALGKDISALLDRLVDSGAADVWFRSVYEPEADRFGGAAAMDAVHQWFDADSTQWMILDRLRIESRAAIARDVLCAAVALDLVTTTLSDGGEVWGVWRMFASGEDGISDMKFGDFAFLTSFAEPGEREVLQEYQEANRRLSTELLNLYQQGKLAAGVRSVIATTILFHFNRHGLDVAAHARIASAMMRAFDPSLPQMKG